uniref:Peptidase metallopeptidase domain-containing protein n=1 Tax=Acrobeloides nanus TaxID=290746 RepID=A0A914DX63_9BILA
MARPHCGMPDFRNYSIYALGSSNKWNKERITYKIRTLTDDLPAQTVRQAFKHAFSAWSEYIPLEFTEAYGVADIEIKFLRGDHQCFIKFDGRGARRSRPDGRPGKDDESDEDEIPTYAPQWPTFPHPRPTPMPHPFYPPPFAPPPPPWMPICCRHPWIFRWNAHGGPGFWSLKSSRNNIERPTHVDAFVNGPGEESYIFVGHHIYELHQNRINKTLRIKDVFPQLENTVSAGYYNEKTHTFVLFDQKNKVYAYHHRRNRDSAILNAGYPKEWPLAIYDESGHEAGLLDPIGAIWITPEAQIFTAQHVNLSGHVVVVSNTSKVDSLPSRKELHCLRYLQEIRSTFMKLTKKKSLASR